MDNKKRKILATVITAIISLLVSVAAIVLGVQPDELVDVSRQNAITVVCSIEQAGQ